MKPFKIETEANQIEDLKLRLLTTRWPVGVTENGWEYGTSLLYLKELCRYWSTGFSWPEQEAMLNELSHFKTNWTANNLHFVYEKGNGVKNIPLLLIHGWPDSFHRFIKLIPLLTEPDENGVAFDVIVPSIPGFGFSDIPTDPGMTPVKIGALFNKLMTETLGYNDFYIHGGDWGASIATQMASLEKEKIKGLHLTNVPPELFLSANFADFGEDEHVCLQAMGKWQRKEGAYVAIQSSKPQTIAFGLNDSPVGLAGWIIEKFNSWGDNDGDIENSFSKDELLTNLAIYWFTQTAGSAARIYYETVHQPPTGLVKINIPAYFAIFPKDCIQIPEAFAKRIFNIQAWEKMDRGGHFPALEVPDLLADHIRSSFVK